MRMQSNSNVVRSDVPSTTKELLSGAFKEDLLTGEHILEPRGPHMNHEEAQAGDSPGEALGGVGGVVIVW